MRKLLISAAAIALFTLSAGAQPDHDRGHEGGGQAPHGAPPGGGHPEHGGGAPHPRPAPNAAPTRGPAGGNPGRPAMTSNPGYSRGPNGGAGFNRPATTTGNPAYSRGPNGGGNFHGAPNNGRPTPGVNRPGGGRDFRSFGQFHQAFNAQRRFRAPAYRRPPGWYARRWTFGEFLPAAFWARDYWLSNYVDYALPPPPFGAVWVRYGNDALLIDQDTGEIITVEYGVFY